MLGSYVCEPIFESKKHYKEKYEKIPPSLVPRTPERKGKKRKKPQNVHFLDGCPPWILSTPVIHYSTMQDRNDEVEGPEKNRTASLDDNDSLGQFLQPLFLARKTFEVRKLSDCTIAYLYTPVMAFRSMCKRFEEEKGRKGRGGFSRLQCAVMSKKSNPIVEQTMRRLRMMIQMWWWCAGVSACRDKVYVACVSL